MFDISSISKRYFQVKLNNGVQLNVEPPKIKTLKKLIASSKVKDEDAIDELTESVKLLLDKNKEHRKVDEEVENMNYDQLTAVLNQYFDWLGKVKKSKN